MNDPSRRWHPFARTRQEDLALLADGQETGWWDEAGHPAPWPRDFLNPSAGWASYHNAHRDESGRSGRDNPPF